MSDLSTITKKAWENIKEGFTLYFIIQLVLSAIGFVVGIAAVIIVLIAAAIVPIIANEGLSTTIFVTSMILVALIAIAIFIGLMIIGAIAQAATVHAVDDVANKKERKDYKHYLRLGYEKKWPVFGLIVVQTLFIAAGMIFFIIPGLLISFFLSLSIFPKVLKGASIGDSFKESYELIKDNFWPTLGKYLLFFIISMVAASLANIIPTGSFIIQLVITIAWVAISYTIYKDLMKSKSKAQS